MNARLCTKHVVLIGVGTTVAALVACSAPGIAHQQNAEKVSQGSSVVIDRVDINGASLGSCSGTLIAAKMVLTAGHCITGAKAWKISSPVGSSTASVASTPWKNFRSDLSHPEHSDIGLIMLDQAITLDTYPVLATQPVADGAKALRFRRAAENANEHVPTETRLKSGSANGFKLNYLVTMLDDEWLDTGGSVVDAKGQIVGVVSGRGKSSGLLHVARVDGYAKWTKSAMSCSSGLAPRTWGGGYGGTPGTSGGGWGGGSGGYGNGGKATGSMDGGTRVPGSSGSDSTQESSSGSSGAPDSGGGTAGTGGRAGSDGTSSSDGDSSSPCVPVCEGECGAGGNGNNGGTGSDGSSIGGSSGSNGTASGERGGSAERCQGSTDNTEACPPAPDSASCNGPDCGGCGGQPNCNDSTIDYGGCATCGSSGNGPLVR